MLEDKTAYPAIGGIFCPARFPPLRFFRDTGKGFFGTRTYPAVYIQYSHSSSGGGRNLAAGLSNGSL